MTKTVYLVCGVPASGKSWVCEQLTNSHEYVDHDAEYETHVDRIVTAANTSDRPIVADIPFGEREIIGKLEARGLTVKPVFINELPSVIAERYLRRTGKALSNSHWVRASRMSEIAKGWNAPYGTSEEILNLLKGSI